MSRLRVALIVSLLLLVASNAFWVFRFAGDIPLAPTSYGCTETEQYVDLQGEIVRPLAAAFNSSLEHDATRESIISAATDENKWPELLTCVTDSDARVGRGRTGLRFEGDKLVAVSTEFCTQYRP